MSETLVAQGLRKAFKGRTVVKDVSFSVSPGEIVGLLGPNGAGKTTSFNMVAGLVPRDAGTVLLGETPLGHLPLYARARLGLGYLPQEPTIFRGLSVLDNFMAMYEAIGQKKREAKRASQSLLEKFQLTKVTDSLGSQLSGGERRRVEMARTLIPNPKIVLLDEPFAGVDPIAVHEIRHFVEQMRDANIGVLITDHNVRETLEICDRAYILSEGTILTAGSPAEIVENKEARDNYLGQNFKL